MKIFQFSLRFKKELNFHEKILSSREGLLFQDEYFWGECSPLPGFSKESLQDAMSLNTELPSVSFGISILKEKITPINPLSSYSLVTNIEDLVKIKAKKNCILKIKVGRKDRDVEINLIRKLCEENFHIRIILDANQKWNVFEAVSYLKNVPQKNIWYVEDPCPNIEDSIIAAEEGKFFIGIDENYRNTPIIPATNVIKAIIIKPTLIGSLTKIDQIIKNAINIKIIPVISSSFESPLGIGLITAWAKKYEQEVLLGLDTVNSFLDQNVFEHITFIGEK